MAAVTEIAGRVSKLSPEKRRLLEEMLRKKQQGEAKSGTLVLPRRRDLGPPPLSFAQERLWFLDRLMPGSAAYLIPGAVRVTGELRDVALDQTVGEIERRHETLRTTFSEGPGGQPVQEITSIRSRRHPRVDLARLADGDRRRQVDRLAAEEASRPFDLATDPMLRLTVLVSGPAERAILFTLHHIAGDAWSSGVLLQEVAALYPALASGQPSGLPELPVQYADFVLWQRERLSGERLERELSYWREALAGVPSVLDLPLDRQRPARPTGRTSQRSFTLSGTVLGRLETLARGSGATLFMVLLAAFQALLSRVAGQADVVVGTPVAGRTRAEVEGLIGFFVNTLVLRVRLADDPTFRGLVARVQTGSVEAFSHQELPFERLVDALGVERSLSVSPIFQVMFTLENAPAARFELPGLLFEPLSGEPAAGKFDLMLSARQTPEGLEGTLQYAAELFDGTTASRWTGWFARLVERAAAEADLPVSALPLASAAEIGQVLLEWNDSACRPAPAVRSPEARFADQVRLRPDAAAVVFEDCTLSVADLDRRSEVLAGRLRALGVGPDVPVGLYLPRSPEQMVALVAIWRAGGAYLPLDPSHPRQRGIDMLTDAGARAVVTVEALAPELADHAGADCPVVVLDRLEAAQGTAVPAPPAPLGSLAYIIFTSGSTGRPKGVGVPRHAVSHLLESLERAVYRGAATADRVAVHAPLVFDASIKQIIQLLAGRTLVLEPEEARLDAPLLTRYLAERQVDVLDVTPSQLELLLDQDLGAAGAPSTVLVGGEAIPPDLWRRLVAHERIRFVDVYGPTETTVDATAETVQPGEPTLGRPLPDVTLYLLDRYGRPAPLGGVGELAISGGGVARGYLARPALTAERFVPDPFSGRTGGRLYRTGDLMRHRPDGKLLYVGRADQQVKVRGFRIELGEVESVLADCPGVREAAVVVQEGPQPGARRLAGFVVLEQGTAAEAVQEELSRRLPAYMVPAVLVALDALPLTPNAKVDRRSLARYEVGTLRGEAAGTAPRDEMEEVVAAVWSEVLGVERVSVDDVFFDLGGHSLLAAQVVSRLRQALGVELPLARFFETPTVAGLARAAQDERRRQEGFAAPPMTPLSPAERAAGQPLSFAQQRLWFIDRLRPGSAAYNMPTVAWWHGALAAARLGQVLSEVVRRHEVLRSVLVEADGVPVQVARPARPVPLRRVDLSALPVVAREREAERLAWHEAAAPFRLDVGPLVRFTIVRLSPERYLLALVMHHVVSDGWSSGVLLEELSRLHRVFENGVPSPLAELPVQYADYAVWQRRWLAGDVLAAELGHWRERLDGAPPVLDLPLDRPRPPLSGGPAGRSAVALTPEVSRSLADFARRQGATPFMVLAGLLGALLSRWSGQEDLVLGTPVAGRDRREIEGLIGFFVNTLPLRLELADEPSFSRWTAAVRERVLAALDHQAVPFERLVEELGVERAPSHSPLFQVVFALQNAPAGALDLNGPLLEPLEVPAGSAKFDLTVVLQQDEGGFSGVVEYAADLFDRTTIRRLWVHLESLAAGALAEPELPLTAVPLLAPSERHQVTAEWSGVLGPTARSTEPETIPELFLERARERPDAAALVMGDTVWSYRLLAEVSGRVASRLRRMGVGRHTPVAVSLPRSPEQVAVLLGILRAGGFYVPLDPDYPRERLLYLLEDAGAAVLVTTQELSWRLPAEGLRALLLEPGSVAPLPELEGEPAWPPPAALSGGDLAYVLYTSGSTGRPKGVAVPHSAVARLVRGSTFADLSPERTWLQLAPVSFDASTLEIWGPLANGGRLAIHPPGPVAPEEIVASLGRTGADSLWLTAALFHQVIDTCAEALSPLKQLLAGGDVLSPQHCRRVLQAVPGLVLVNGYGPTENTTFTCCHPMIDPEAVGEPVPVGRPIAGTETWGVDRHLQPVPVGVAGELVSGGRGLAHGYWRRPALTAGAFVPNPFGAPGSRLYRTGDLVRWQPDGRIGFLGRIDAQVKIRGFRIEPGEIESVLSGHPEVRESLVLVQGEGSVRRLVAYVAGRVEARDLRERVAASLPDYMMPSGFVVLERFPVTPNGKVDRRALTLEPEAAAGPDRETFFDPTEEIVAGAFAQVLGRERVGRRSDFFELGGHSLLATQVVSRLREALGVELPLQTIFAAPSVDELAAAVRELRAERGREAAPPLVPLPVEVRRAGELPLSFAQIRMWFLDRVAPGSPAYHVPLVARAKGVLPPAPWRQALSELVRRHEVLRTTFAESTGEPVQRIAQARPVPLPVVDLRDLSPAARDALARRLVGEETARPFDLAAGPVLRLRLLRLSGDEHVLSIVQHHVASDGWSMGVLLRELGALSTAFGGGVPSPLPELPVQYADFSAWQRSWLAGERLEREVDLWRRHLDGAPPEIGLPTDRPRPPVQTFHGRSLPVRLGRELADAVAALGRRLGATPFMVLLAAWGVVLGRVSGQDDVVIGAPVAGRNRREIEGLIGFFVNTLALRLHLVGGESVERLLERVREMTLWAFDHQDVPFERLVEELAGERSLSHSPLFQTMLALQNAPVGSLALPGLELTPLDGASETAKFDLVLALAETPEGLEGALTGNADLFDATTEGRLARRLVTVLERMTAHPERRLDALDGMCAAERQQVLAEWSDTAHSEPEVGSVRRWVEVRAAERPGAPALVSRAGRLSYGELDHRASRLAGVLAQRGVGPEVVVGVALPRSVEQVVALLAVWKAGGIYLPLDVAHPVERLAYELEDSRAPLVITTGGLAASLPGEAILLDDFAELPPPLKYATADDGGLGAYAIYTSGSTGRPKGVLIEHRSLTHLVAWHVATFGLTDRDRVAHLAGLGFDASVWELWPALSAGASVHLPPEEIRVDPERLRDWLLGEGITVTFVPTPVAEALLELDWPAEAPLRILLTGGDKLHRPPPPGLPFVLVNDYGPTENTVVATSGPVPPAPETGRAPDLGRPIYHVRLCLADRRLEPVPIGAAGEVLLGGGSLARGYLGKPALTAAAFVPDPHGGPSARRYRTGDLGRFLADGRLEFLGRIDHQVQVRGVRVELGEIEAVLAAHPAVREVAVLAVGEGAELRLAAFVVGGAELAELSRHAALRLPEAMVPSWIEVLERFPLTANGKVDRRRLAERVTLRQPDADHEPPRSVTEEILAGLFAEVLGLERVGRGDDFFRLGGHSLLATRVASRLRQALRVELPLKTLFEAPTVAALARAVDEIKHHDSPAPPLTRLPAERRRDDLPLSFAQQRLWFLSRLEPDSPAYNVPAAMRIGGSLVPPLLTQVVGEILRRHEALRTAFVERDGQPVQRVLPPLRAAVPVTDLSGLSLADREACARGLASAESARLFRLEAGEVARFRLLRLGGEDHGLLVTFHHVAADGWSLTLFLGELAGLTGNLGTGCPSGLPELSVQYPDFAAWQRSWLVGDVLEREVEHWREQLVGAPAVLELPIDRPRPPVMSFRGRSLPVHLPPELSRRVSELARRQECTLFMALLSAFALVLGRSSGQSDVVVGAPVAGRNRREIEDLIGFFVNTLALRARLSPRLSFAGLLEQVRATSLAAYDHQDVPFEKLVERLGVERNLSTTPLFQAMLVLQSAGGATLPQPPGLSVEPLQAESTTAKFDVLLALAENAPGEGIAGSLEHSSDLFDATTVERLWRRLEAVLEAAADDPERPVADLPWLSPAELHQVAVEWNDTAPVEPSQATLASLLRAQLERTPNEEALVTATERWTYRQLHDRAWRLARRFRTLGIGPESRVGVGLERSADLVATLLAVLEAGGAYVPLDPAYPAERLTFVAEDAGVGLLVTRGNLLPDLSVLGVPRIDLDTEPLLEGGASAEPLPPAAGPGNLSYLIYTSGSTGRPKGVAIEHRSAVALLSWAQRVFTPGELSGMLAATSINFDLSVFEIFLPLVSGGRVILADNALALPAHPARGEVRLVNTVPSAMTELVRLGEIPDSVETVCLAGEPLKRALVDGIYSVSRARRIYNLYGPSEDTTYSTWVRVDPGEGEPTIGVAVGETQAWVLDGRMRAAPLGVVGELFLSGAGLARGYLGRPARTAAGFVPSPFGPAGSRLYRTGDLARWTATGQLQFLGRADHQVKVRGFRIELGEIETVLARHEAVEEAVVLALGETSERRLVGYVQPAGDARPAPDELRTHLLERLPDYMVPAVFLVLDELPLTPNGKVDRKRLASLSPERTARQRGAAEAPPSDVVEEVVAGVWAEVLELERIGAHDDFFALGGHSLLATQVVSRLREAFEIELPLQRLFEAPTVAQLAETIRRAAAGPAAPPLTSMSPRRPGELLPASYAQEALWRRLARGGQATLLPAGLRLAGRLDPRRVDQVIGEILRRQELLRARFVETQECLALALEPPRPGRPLPRADVTALAAADRERELQRAVEANAVRPFDLGRAPARFTTLDLGAADQALLLAFHPLVGDGLSMDLLLADLGPLLEAFAAGRPSPLPELRVQYADYAAWQRRWLDGALEEQIAAWRRVLAGAAATPIPGELPAPEDDDGTVDTLPIALPPELSRDLAALGRRDGATTYMVLLAVFAAFLGRETGVSDVVLGSPVAGREHHVLGGVAGRFVNTLPVRVDLSGAPTFRELLRRVRRSVLDAFSRQELPYDRLVEELGTDLVGAEVNVKNMPDVPLELPGLPVQPLEPERARRDRALFLGVGESISGISGGLQYSLARFSSAAARDLLRGFEALLRRAVERPEEPLWEAPRDGIGPLPFSTLELRRPVVVPIREGGERRPLFLAHPVGGNVLCYAELSRWLAPDRPVYGLQRPDLGGVSELDLPVLAQCYAAAIREVEPRGPYLLGGWSSGGAVAFEVARALAAEGEEVALLALIDSAPPAGPVPLQPEEELTELFFRELEGVPASRLEAPETRDLFELFNATAAALARYRPGPYEGRIALLLASEGEAAPVSGWESLASGGVDLEQVPGSHKTMIRRPAVEELARALDRLLSASERRREPLIAAVEER